jgi:hypothetical protein
MSNICEIDVILVTPDNLQKYILPSEPLHPAYEFLSETHKADYLRTYFMHFHGGGYSDIKLPSGSWVQAFEDIISNPNILINGYHESSEDTIAGDDYVKLLYKEIPANSAYIIRPNTEFTKEWYRQLLSVLDSKLEALKKNPSTHPQAQFTPNISPGYPIQWTEILGNIFHPLTCKYRDRILFTTPNPVINEYR